MEIKYRIAGIDDIDDIVRLVAKAIEQMERDEIYQWDSIYPAKEDFYNDMQKNELYVGTVNDEIAVVYALNKEYDEQYKNGEWKYTGENFIVIHRLCVSPDFQNKGIAYTTLSHIESELSVLGIKSIRLDVFCANPYALKLYSNNGYYEVGTANLRKGRFLLMEKLL